MSKDRSQAPFEGFAIVGMAARLPGAGSTEAFWNNLKEGVCSIQTYSREELLAAGEEPHLINQPNYVPAGAPLEDFEEFDAEFFGLSPKDAAIMDPQHRQFLEVAWEAMENAGRPPESVEGTIGVYGGCGMGSYFYFNVCSNTDLVDGTGMFLLRHTGNDKDFLTTRVSHAFDLRGPSVNVQTACSTSLVAIHYATQALEAGECDMALAGGVTIEMPHNRGYLYRDGEVLSPDGACHAFDHRAQGTVFGSGAGVVVLKRLEDAVRDNDHIWAVINATAITNDGASKAGYLAPSVEGQAKAITQALRMAETPAETIDYVECHGTGTYLGDPIEVAALTEAFSGDQPRGTPCKLGSVKTNIGHTDTAAGVASVIKTALALKHQKMPPSLGYEEPNPAIDFDTGSFEVSDQLADWNSKNGPRRAGVNSLGVGGTNAFAVLEEAPERAASEPSEWPFELLTLSGLTPGALEGNTENLCRHLQDHPDQLLADVAFTLKEGRRAFDIRRLVAAPSGQDAAELLRDQVPDRVFTHQKIGDDPGVVFMFPGGGAQYSGMARDLYETEPVFAEWMDRGIAHLNKLADYDIRALWLPDPGAEAAADAALQKPSVQLPLIMIVEYALAQLWMSWGVRPAALVGHSMGENTAACLAGVMRFEDCVGLVHLRGQLFDTVPNSGMLSVALPAKELAPLLGDDLDLGAVNAPLLSVATGSQQALDRLQTELEAREIAIRRIAIDVAAHSRMLDPILDTFRAYLQSIDLKAPDIPFASNCTGEMISDAEATDPDYWVRHLRDTVLFSDCITTLASGDKRIFLEVGPGKTLTSLVAQHKDVAANQVIQTLRHAQVDVADDLFFQTALGRLWALGGQFDWSQIWGEARRNRVPLPTYAFQHSPYFIEQATNQTAHPNQWLIRNENKDEWGYSPIWRPTYAKCDIDVETELSDAPLQTWLVFPDDAGLCSSIIARLREVGHRVVTVTAGDTFARQGKDAYVMAPERGLESYDALIQDLVARDLVPRRIIHGWLATAEERFRPGSSFFHRNLEQGFFSLLFLAQAMGQAGLPDPVHITTLVSGTVQVRDEPLPYPEKSTVKGPARVIPREFPGITCSLLDIGFPAKTDRRAAALDVEKWVNPVLEDLFAPPRSYSAALRGEKRFEKKYRRQALPPASEALSLLRENGTYLITGGFGGIGLIIARGLIEHLNATVVLLSRSKLPLRERWDQTLANTAPGSALARRIEAVREIESAGGRVIIQSADVSNVEEMRAARTTIEAKVGQIHGVIHAAGVVEDGLIMGKSLTEIEDVFAPKIHGTQVLDEVFPDGDLDLMMLFSSTSTATAPAGQVDYVAANEYLNAYARSRLGGKTRVCTLDWGVWADTGMAAEAMAARTGTNIEMPVLPADVPMLDKKTFDRHGNRMFTAEYSVSDMWVINDHRTRAGDALLPGTGYIELVAEALQAQGETAAFEIRDMYFLQPLAVADTAPLPIEVELPRTVTGYDFSVKSGPKATPTVNAQASVSLLPQTTPRALDLDEIAARCAAPTKAPKGTWLSSRQETHLRFGPRWRVLRSTALGQGEGLAHLNLPEIAHGDIDNGYVLHPGLMDLATGWAMDLIEDYQPTHLWVPVFYGSVRVYRPLPQEIVSWVRSGANNHVKGEIANFDITIATPDGDICVEVEGFSIRRMQSVESFAANTNVTPLHATPKDTTRPLTPAEERLRHNLSQGIRAEEGMEMLLRAVALNQPQVVISSMDLPGLIAQAGLSDAPETSGLRFQRPELSANFIAPEGPVETRLAGIWQDLLGVDQVGAEDSFFDLGGHSLIAVRMFTQIRKTWDVEFPISLLFEAPTVRTVAAQIEARGKAQARPPTDTPTIPARRFSHLVPMHSGEGGPKTPFFLVAGMFGNVLNLRHLAHLLGTDRPFYGLQARGLFGTEEPHRTIPEAARDYIAEMRQVQPHGPYIVGGFSGGGITAYEIAQQLTAEGETISALVMLDTPLPQRPALTRRDRIAINLLSLREGGASYIGTWFRNRIEWERKKRSGDTKPEIADDSPQFREAAIEAAFLESVATYDVAPWSGPLSLFRPPLQATWEVAPGRLIDKYRHYMYVDNNWTQHAPNIEVFEVPGDHDSMVLEPNVRVLAERIKRVLEATEHSQGHATAAFWEAAE